MPRGRHDRLRQRSWQATHPAASDHVSDDRVSVPGVLESPAGFDALPSAQVVARRWLTDAKPPGHRVVHAEWAPHAAQTASSACATRSWAVTGAGADDVLSTLRIGDDSAAFDHRPMHSAPVDGMRPGGSARPGSFAASRRLTVIQTPHHNGFQQALHTGALLPHTSLLARSSAHGLHTQPSLQVLLG